MTEEYKELRERLRRVTDIRTAMAVLNWDQETYMPPLGAEKRAVQLSTLAGISHEMFTHSGVGILLEKLRNASLPKVEGNNVRLIRRDYEREKKYPGEFVEKLSLAVSSAFQAWQEAKKQKDFQIFAPKLEKLVELKLEEAELLGYDEHPYDALLDLYEPGTTTAFVQSFFDQILPDLKKLIGQITAQVSPPDEFMRQEFDEDRQWAFSLQLLKQMGYDFKAGRQDKSSHPFSIAFNPKDVRITTRVKKDNLAEIVWSSIHEGGHALYEQGLPIDQFGLPAGEALSLAIHESQSRLWENCVGRGLPYWEYNFPLLKEQFPRQLGKVTVEQFYSAMNRVQPSLVRTNADELTYHLHVYIRFLIEREIIGGDLKVKDVRERWNNLYEEYLNVKVPSDEKGVLQDIHWSHGSFGYFPTYSLGSFYAAQFYQQIERAVPELDTYIRKGDLKPVLDWLRENIHSKGRQMYANELCREVTGRDPDPKSFMDYAWNKYGKIYPQIKKER